MDRFRIFLGILGMLAITGAACEWQLWKAVTTKGYGQPMGLRQTVHFSDADLMRQVRDRQSILEAQEAEIRQIRTRIHDAQIAKQHQIFLLCTQLFIPNVDRKYGQLFAKLSLNQNSVAALQDLLLKRMAGVRADGTLLPPNAPAAEIRSFAAANERSIKELLGENGYATFKTFEALIPQRNARMSLLQSFGADGAPLTLDQQNQLNTVLSGTGALGANPVQLPRDSYLRATDNYVPDIAPAVFENLSNVLTPAQREVLIRYQALQDARDSAAKAYAQIALSADIRG